MIVSAASPLTITANLFEDFSNSAGPTLSAESSREQPYLTRANGVGLLVMGVQLQRYHYSSAAQEVGASFHPYEVRARRSLEQRSLVRHIAPNMR